MSETRKSESDDVAIPPNTGRALQLLQDVRRIRKNACTESDVDCSCETVVKGRDKTPLAVDDSVELFDNRVANDGPLPRVAFPDTLARFKVKKKIGTGGFSEVFLAYDPLLNRDVALKVPKLATMASEEYARRFSREARAAGILSHPAIVPVYESGNVGPLTYIAYQFCEGPTLAAWLKSQKSQLPVTAAVQVVEKLADAVEYAHQRGVIHRDLKPTNIIVTESCPDEAAPKLKITDFGLARYQRDIDQLETVEGAVVGTPAYMSPEQAAGDKQVGTATDIWSLGVILYELLTGQLPFQRETMLATLHAIERESIPPVKKLRPEVPRALVAIVQRCLSKNPGDRYASAHELALDLVRWQRREPVKARPISALAKASLWTQRNPILAAVGSLAVTFLSLGLAGTTWQYVRANENLKQAQAAVSNEKEARHKAERISSLFTSTYQRTKPGLDGRKLTVVEMLGRTAEQIRSEFADDVNTRWELLFELALTYDGLGVFDQSVAILEEIYDEQILAPNDMPSLKLKTAQSLQRSLRSLGHIKRANQIADEAIQLADQVVINASMRAQIYQTKGLVLDSQGKHDEALIAFKMSVEFFDQASHDGTAESLGSRILLATSQRMLGRFEEAVLWLDDFVPDAVASYGKRRPKIITLLQEYAAILTELKRYNQAIEVLTTQAKLCDDIFGRQHGRTLQVKGNLASTLTRAGRQNEAVEIYLDVVKISQSTFGSENPNVAVPRYLLGNLYRQQSDFEAAEIQLVKSYQTLVATVGIENRWTTKSHSALVKLWTATKQWQKLAAHFTVRAEQFSKEGENGGTGILNAAIASIEAGQAMIRANDVGDGIDLINEGIEFISDDQNAEQLNRCFRSILSCLIETQQFSHAVPFVEQYLENTLGDDGDVSEGIKSRIFAAAIGRATEQVDLENLVAEIDLEDAAQLNTAHWHELNSCFDLLSNVAESEELSPECLQLLRQLQALHDEAIR